MSTVLIERLRAVFETHRDPEKAVGMAAYMRGRFPFLGIQTPHRRQLSREVTTGLEPPSEQQLCSSVRRIWKLPEREYQYFGADYFVAHGAGGSSDLLSTARWLIVTKSWWDTVDALASHGVGTLVAGHPRLAKEMDRWIEDENLWVARAALLHQLTYKGATDETRLFDYCLRHAESSEFFLRKAIGWALREYSKTAPRAVRRFVRTHENALSGLSRREALKWLDRAKRPD